MNLKVGGLAVTILVLSGVACKQRAELPTPPPETRPAESFQNKRAEGQFTACKSNLKNMGVACEMYAVDWDGLYPAEPSVLTPNYLKALPQCPAADADTYTESYQSNLTEVLKDRQKKGQESELQSTYAFHCLGHHHEMIGKGENKPAYDSVRGLVE